MRGISQIYPKIPATCGLKRTLCCYLSPLNRSDSSIYGVVAASVGSTITISRFTTKLCKISRREPRR